MSGTWDSDDTREHGAYPPPPPPPPPAPPGPIQDGYSPPPEQFPGGYAPPGHYAPGPQGPYASGPQGPPGPQGPARAGGGPYPGWQPTGFPQAGPYMPGPPPVRMTGGIDGGGRKVFISLVAVFVLITAGFAAVNLSASGTTGAASPEDAIQQFFDAVGNEDAIGVLEVLDPAERDVMRPFVTRLKDELTRLGITDDVDLEDVPGFDLEVEGLEVTSQELTPGMAQINITGGVFRYQTIPDAIPIGDVLRDLIEANDGDATIEQTHGDESMSGEDVFLVATETDGRWHLSLFFTIAEYARQDMGEPVPDLNGGVSPQGAATAEDAVREFAEAAAALDLERMIAMLAPDEMRALQVYAPLFLDDAQADIEEYRAEEGFEATVEEMEFETSDVDGGTRVVPTAATFSFETYEGEMSLSYGDGCVEVSGDLAEDFVEDIGDTRVCTDDLDSIETDLDEEDAEALRELGELFTDFQPGVVVVQRDGAFYVDPLRTFDDLTFQVLAGVERADLEEGGILYRLFTGELFGWDDDYYYDDEYDDCDYSDDDEDC